MYPRLGCASCQTGCTAAPSPCGAASSSTTTTPPPDAMNWGAVLLAGLVGLLLGNAR